MITRESALQWIEEYRKNPVFDLDNPPDLDSFPKVFIVSGKNTEQHKKLGSRIVGFSIDVDYPTREAAEAQVERMKTTWKDLVPESTEIREADSKDVQEFCWIQWLNDVFVVEGQQTPIYLP